MLTRDLFDSILIKPAQAGADTLYILSGYATSAMAFHHLNHLSQKSINLKVKLLIGMCPEDGLSLSNHKGFQKIVQEDFAGHIECSYLVRGAVHSKVYTWLKAGRPFCGFLGSANYTQTAFADAESKREAMESCDAREGLRYFRSLAGDSIYCTHPDSENLVTIYNDRYYQRLRRETRYREEQPGHDIERPELFGLPRIKITLLDNHGDLPRRSGLNWGQRPEYQRDPNQAYIHVPASVYRTTFFPPIASHFTVLTDDGKVLICSRAQQNGKAIHTPHKNSLIGEYFRNRLGIASGERVIKDDLLHYGRTDIDFYKIDNETYYLDFSPPHDR